MTIYRMTRVIDATQTLEVEIDDTDMTEAEAADAAMAAYEDHSKSYPSACGYCGDYFELGDPLEFVAVYRGDKQIWSEPK